MKNEQIIIPAISYNNNIIGGFSHITCIKALEGILGEKINESQIVRGYLTSNTRFLPSDIVGKYVYNKSIKISTVNRCELIPLVDSYLKEKEGEYLFSISIKDSFMQWAENKYKDDFRGKGYCQKVSTSLYIANIRYVGEILRFSKEELMNVRGLGKNGISLITEWLDNTYSLKLIEK